MRATHHETHGAPEVLRPVSMPDPVCGPGEVLVSVRAASVNRIDVLQRRGPGLLPGFALPHVPGTDVAGVVVGAGPDVTTRSTGDRVLVDPSLHCGTCEQCAAGHTAFCPGMRVVGASRQGGYAELIAVPETHTHLVPDHIGFEEAAGIPAVYSMAWQALMVRGRLRAGETLLVHGAGSGITIAAVQIARRHGARVIVTSASEEKLAKMAKLGADVTIDHGKGDLAAQVREVTGGLGADIVLDHVGPALFQASLASLRTRGRLVFCGDTTGPTATFSLVGAYHRGLTLIGSESHDHPTFADMVAWYWSAGCEPVIDSVFPLAEAAQAHRRLESGETFGKILLVP
ncbi:alcohol dehydrogenase [Microtetraspora sp. NBRC 13810]|uniref:zinc-binding dehydrogenase n=1 Tax=Microtetraspora sp. NBRC 13810 TaxID=3030990 RepID=UPI002553E7FB|nr:zinc-binding dehydrogenase [Microtetraspora sp. NBRC 13810]GLW09026.1 alcohol dehydrogenase [Microtetraspora sp. NBRC 13810]